MKYYHYHPAANDYDGLGLQMKDHHVTKMHSKSISLSASWSPVAVHGFEDNPGVEGDFPALSNRSKIPVFSQRAWDVLEPLIGYCSEALPIRYPTGQPFYIINVMDIIDCLDEERSEVKRYTDGGIMRVVSFCLKTDLLHGKHIFKTPLKSGADIIVSDEFRRWVEENNLRGLRFRELPMVEVCAEH